MKVFFNNLRQLLTSRIWLPALLAAIVGGVLAVGLTELRLPPNVILDQYLWPGDTSSAADMLSFIASTTMTVLTSTISMTLIVLQVASGSYSQQLLRDFIQSPAVRGIIAVYSGVFTYALLALRSLNTDAEQPPHIAMTVAMVLIIIALATFVWYVSKVVDMIRVDNIIEGSATRTIRLADQLRDDSKFALDSPIDPVARPDVPSHARKYEADGFGYVARIDHELAAEWAREHDGMVVIDIRPGDMIISGQTLAYFWTDSSDDECPELPKIIYHEQERVSGQDFSLGLRQLLDITVRALSTSTNDPTTALHAIGQSSAVLRHLVRNPSAPTVLFEHSNDDEEGRLVLWAANRTEYEMVRSFAAEIRRYGADEPDVLIALLSMLHMVDADTSSDSMREMIAEEEAAVLRAAKRSIEEENDLNRVLSAARMSTGEEPDTAGDGV